jgi:ribosomal RNA assembly protein
METIYLQKTNELKREKEFLEYALKVAIKIRGKKISVEGDALDEYEAIKVLEAMNYGFSARTAALIIGGEFVFREIPIKEHTRRKNLELVRGRLIGTHGKTKNTLEQISGSVIRIKDNTVAVIAPAEEISYITTAITNILKGTKQQNSYKFLERINTKRKFHDDKD